MHRIGAGALQINDRRLLADQFRLRMQDTNEGNWKEENGWSCAENSIELYTDFSTQPLFATIFSNKYSSITLAFVSGEIPAFVEFLHICQAADAIQAIAPGE